MTTAIKLGSLHAKVAGAEAEVQQIEGELKAAREAVASLSARRKELDGTLEEARIEEAMGRQPKRSIADVKADLALGEDLQMAQARVVGIDRLKEEAAAHLATLKEELRHVQVAWCAERAAQVTGQMLEAARALQQAQYKVVAFARAMAQRPALHRETGNLIPSHLLYAEIVSSMGSYKDFPHMGDRKIANEQLLADITAIEQALESL